MNSHPVVMKYFLKSLTEKESLEFYNRIQDEFMRCGYGLYAVEKKENGEFIGYTGFHNFAFNVDFAPGVEIGWRLKHEEWKRGYATEAAKACLIYAKEHLPFKSIWSFTSISNKSSERVMQKIGMTRVKEFPHPLIPDNHPLKEHVLYEIKNMTTIAYSNGASLDFINLCNELDDYFNAMNGKEKQNGYNQYNTLNDIVDIWVAYEGNTPVGCAAFKLYEDKTAEVKRVFVKPVYRGKGIAKALMRALEEKAWEKGYKFLLLETGKRFKEAVGLYQSMGYVVIENYGQYKGLPESVCMMKNLSESI